MCRSRWTRPTSATARLSTNEAGPPHAASLTALLRPRSVAVVGASRRPGSVGQAVLLKIRQGGFTGPVWAVNPYADTVAA